MHDQRRSLDPAGVHHRRAVEVVAVRVVGVGVQEQLVEPPDVRRVVEREPVGDGCRRNRGLEAVGLRDRPGRHEPAVAAAVDPDALAVGDAVGDQDVDAGQDVVQVAAAHVADVGAGEDLAVAAAAAGVGLEQRVAGLGRPRVHQAGEAPEVHAGRPAVDVDDQRQRAGWRRAGVINRPSISVPSNDVHVTRRHAGRGFATASGLRAETARQPVAGAATSQQAHLRRLVPGRVRCGQHRAVGRRPTRSAPSRCSAMPGPPTAPGPRRPARACRPRRPCRAGPRTTAIPRRPTPGR